MTQPRLNEDQKDALQELTNVAIGRAGASLGVLLDTFVELSVPHAQIVSVADAEAAFAKTTGLNDETTIVRQSFFNLIQGEALVIYDSEGAVILSDLMGHEFAGFSHQELLLDTSNLIIGAVLSALGEQLSGEFAFTSPELLEYSKGLEHLFQSQDQNWSYALLIDITFALEARDFSCQVIFLVPESSIELILSAIEQILAEI